MIWRMGFSTPKDDPLIILLKGYNEAHNQGAIIMRDILNITATQDKRIKALEAKVEEQGINIAKIMAEIGYEI